MYDVAIIGCGISGAALAYELSLYRLKVLVLEKENDIALGATRANSAIIHAGYDPEPGTLMARLNVEGCRMAPEICKRLSVSYRACPSLVLAFDAEDAKSVQKLYERGVKNGVPGLEILSGDQVRTLEPHVSTSVCAALYAPSSGIINPWDYALAFAEVAVQNGVELHLSTPVSAINRTHQGYMLFSGSQCFEAKRVVNAAGVDSAALHNLVAPKAFNIIPTKGSYYLMDKSEGFRARHVLFQCPSARGKGVLVTPTVHGNLLVGPDAAVSDDAHRVNTTAESLDYIKAEAAKSVPDINYRASIRCFAGMRANSDQKDFVIRFAAPGFLDLAGIKSPGLSSAPAIAKYAAELLAGDGLELTKKENPITERKKIRFKELSTEEKRRLISVNPLYGRVICRCETITEGEIVDAIHSPIPPVSVDGIKRRAGTGMGRCQGGFCGPRVVDILARERGVSPVEILKDTSGSYILCGDTREGGAQ